VKSVFIAESPAEAHLVAGLLDEAGIRNVVEGEMLFGVRADIGLTPASLPRICVNEEDFERARTVIEKRDPTARPAASAATSAPSRGGRKLDAVVLIVIALAVVSVTAWGAIQYSLWKPVGWVVFVLVAIAAAVRLNRRS